MKVHHPTDFVLINCSTFKTVVSNLLIKAKYGQPDKLYSGEVMINYYGNKINYVDCLDKEEFSYRTLESNEIPKELTDWFNEKLTNHKVYTCVCSDKLD